MMSVVDRVCGADEDAGAEGSNVDLVPIVGVEGHVLDAAEGELLEDLPLFAAVFAQPQAVPAAVVNFAAIGGMDLDHHAVVVAGAVPPADLGIGQDVVVRLAAVDCLPEAALRIAAGRCSGCNVDDVLVGRIERKIRRP